LTVDHRRERDNDRLALRDTRRTKEAPSHDGGPLRRFTVQPGVRELQHVRPGQRGERPDGQPGRPGQVDKPGGKPVATHMPAQKGQVTSSPIVLRAPLPRTSSLSSAGPLVPW
jgi:hypothetical protein